MIGFSIWYGVSIWDMVAVSLSLLLVEGLYFWGFGMRIVEVFLFGVSGSVYEVDFSSGGVACIFFFR